jgi:hypothetical protein
MKKKLTVMVPVDFTPVSFKAIEFLGFLMDKIPVATHLVHVVQVNSSDWAGSPGFAEALDTAAVGALEQQARGNSLLPSSSRSILPLPAPYYTEG